MVLDLYKKKQVLFMQNNERKLVQIVIKMNVEKLTLLSYSKYKLDGQVSGR